MSRPEPGTFAERLTEYLNEHGMKKTALAHKIGVGSTTVMMWTYGKSEPTLYSLRLLVKATGLDANYWAGV